MTPPSSVTLLRGIASWTTDKARLPVQQAVARLFAHDGPPLEAAERRPGDPGLFGPGSVSWEVIGHPAAFVGGIRALVVQAAHPEVLAGVVDHSTYRTDPLGRLSRTADWVTATTFGSHRDVERVTAAVRHAHRAVVGSSPRGRPYAAFDPALAAFVHNVLVESFLVAYQWYGPGLPPGDADRFVAEQRRVGALLGVVDQPDTAAGLHAWVAGHPSIGASPDQPDTESFLRHPPLPAAASVVYSTLYQGAVATVPIALRTLLDLTVRPGAVTGARYTVAALGAALGESPARQLARRRCALARS